MTTRATMIAISRETSATFDANRGLYGREWGTPWRDWEATRVRPQNAAPHPVRARRGPHPPLPRAPDDQRHEPEQRPQLDQRAQRDGKRGESESVSRCEDPADEKRRAEERVVVPAVHDVVDDERVQAD